MKWIKKFIPKPIRNHFRVIKRELSYLFVNKFVNRIPSWRIRRLFYIGFGMKIGKDARINIGAVIDHPQNIVVGDRSVINENAYLDGRGGLTIGQDVSISIYSKVITASHEKDSSSFAYFNNSVIIEDNVWLGVGAIICDGSHLKKNAIVGAGCVVKGIIDENGIYIGNPAKKIGDRKLNEQYHISNLLHFR